MGKIIEFYGPPGSGKTTLANISIKYLKSNGINAVNFSQAQYIGFKRWLVEPKQWTSESYFKKMEILESLLKHVPNSLGKMLLESDWFSGKYIYKQDLEYDFMIENLGLYNIIINKLHEIYEYNEGKKRWFRFKNDFFKYQVAKDHLDKEILVLHEAFCKHISSAHSLLRAEKLPVNYERGIKEFTKLISDKIDYAFFISARPDLCLERQRKRGHLVGEKINKKRRNKDFEVRYKNSLLIHETLKEEGVSVYRIKNNKSLNVGKEKLISILDEVISEIRN